MTLEMALRPQSRIRVFFAIHVDRHIAEGRRLSPTVASALAASVLRA